MSTAQAAPLDPIEIACGIPLGTHPGIATPPPESHLSPRQALEEVVLDALRRSPCVVSFSGGQDSSAVLALAVSVARREGLPLPVAATTVFPGSAETDEGEYQRHVLKHLGVTDHVRIELHEELGALGPAARAALTRHGLIWPANLHFALPILELARGGSLLTGVGGDELGRIDGALHAERVVAGYASARRPRDAARVAYRRSPSIIRTAREYVRGAQYIADMPWLTKRARRIARRRFAEEYTLPWGYQAIMSFYWKRRAVQVGRSNFAVLGSAYSATVHHPFVDERTISAFAATGGLTGHGDRRQILERHLGDLLPNALIQRRTKASFDDPLWTADTIEFARSWSGEGVEGRLVDAEKLRREWLSGRNNLISVLLLQSTWLADSSKRINPR